MCLCVVLVYIKIHQDTSRYVKIRQDSQDTSRYIKIRQDSQETSRYIKTHQDTSIYVKIRQDTSRYITTMKFVMPKIAVQERKVNFNNLKNSIIFGFRFRKVAFCVNQNRSERQFTSAHSEDTQKKRSLHLKLNLYVAVSADKTAV